MASKKKPKDEPAPAFFTVEDIARARGLRFMVRLVKGAYWDGEIKRAQELGLAGYPVWTDKRHTDLSYLACAQRLLAAPEIYPQFATHNAGTIGAILQAWYWSQLSPFDELPVPEDRVVIPPSGIVGLNLETAVASSRNWSGYVLVEEIG